MPVFPSLATRSSASDTPPILLFDHWDVVLSNFLNTAQRISVVYQRWSNTAHYHQNFKPICFSTSETSFAYPQHCKTSSSTLFFLGIASRLMLPTSTSSPPQNVSHITTVSKFHLNCSVSFEILANPISVIKTPAVPISFLTRACSDA
jgi:hypothetical protein